jgi:XTP/dITP diphosphohydrolase
VEILFATGNQGKITEVLKLFENTEIVIRSTRDSNFTEIEVAETGHTFADNALLKAQAYSRAYSVPVLADDSGLTVTALDGKPGVASNRWHPGTDADRNKELLRKLSGITDRRAQFVSVVCFLPNSTGKPHFFTGIIHGTITTTPRGKEGFGYDPIFVPDGYTKTFAQLGIRSKNTLSHRAQAFGLAADFLKKQYQYH